MECRERDPKAIQMAGLAIDGRIDVIACPKKWKEADIWEGARRGEKDLWMDAREGKYLQRSRAFTVTERSWDIDSDYDLTDY